MECSRAHRHVGEEAQAKLKLVYLPVHGAWLREGRAQLRQHMEEEEALGRAAQGRVKSRVCNAWGGGGGRSALAHLHLDEEALRDVARSRSSISPAHGGGRRSRKRGCCEKPKVDLAGRWKRHFGRRSSTSPYGRLDGIHGDIYASPRDHICASLRNWALPIFKTSLQFAEDAYALVLQWRCMQKWTCRSEIGVGLSLFKWL
uniref:Uncharacterized protein n=1 Tax=Oryza glumipatula TaxID=40148 RepID=A0A0E0ARP5_9ORYZ